MKTVLVTGGKGQLALCMKDATNSLKEYNFIYVDYDELDITKKPEVDAFFLENRIDYCINCAAYTAVDKAEKEEVTAKLINEIGAKNLAEACKKSHAILVHISTDFVFDGKKNTPYLETDEANPISVYGLSKLKGEIAVSSVLEQYFIIRTSWLYSEHGNNFLKTMLKLAEEKDELNIIYDQIGTPTYAGDLADVILKLIFSDMTSYGTYHFSNEGVAGWYDFSKNIFDISGFKVTVNPIKTEAYKTDAERPKYSVLDKTKIKEMLKIEIPYWRESLKTAIIKLGHLNN
jgi:dTDP-4-dehydrorhamnose reductase